MATHAYRRHSFKRSFVFLTSTFRGRYARLDYVIPAMITKCSLAVNYSYPLLDPGWVTYASRTVRFKRHTRTELDENERWRREIASTTRMSSL